MRYTEPATRTAEERLLQRKPGSQAPAPGAERPWRPARRAPPRGSGIRPPSPSGPSFWSSTVLIVVAFFAGYIPLQKRTQTSSAAEAHEQEQALPRVEVIEVGRSSHNSELELPGNIQAITEAPILARADGYIQRRMVDIGDRVQAGQPLAEIEAPELDEQVRQAKASLQQAQAALEQALANYEQGKANMELARVTAERWTSLVGQRRGLAAGERPVSGAVSGASRERARARKGHCRRSAATSRPRKPTWRASMNMQSYRVVKAPFDGVITLRNVDVGALVNAGNTLLFRIAQTATLRTYVNVPQTNASSVQARPTGATDRFQSARPPLRRHRGAHRELRSIPTSRTLLVEVQVPNADGALLPGMYAQVDLSSARANPPLLVPERRADRSRRRHPGRRGPPGSHRASPEDRSRPRLRRPAGGHQRAAGRRHDHPQPRRRRARRPQGQPGPGSS